VATGPLGAMVAATDNPPAATIFGMDIAKANIKNWRPGIPERPAAVGRFGIAPPFSFAFPTPRVAADTVALDEAGMASAVVVTVAVAATAVAANVDVVASAVYFTASIQVIYWVAC